MSSERSSYIDRTEAEPTCTLRISRNSDSIWVSRECARYAKRIGFQNGELWDIAIAVSELVTNVSKFAGTGTVTICWLRCPRKGIEMVVEDRGPGIEDIEAASEDGFSEGRKLDENVPLSERRGLGAGLGAVHRLMDDVIIENRASGGVRVIVRKWLPH